MSRQTHYILAILSLIVAGVLILLGRYGWLHYFLAAGMIGVGIYYFYKAR